MHRLPSATAPARSGPLAAPVPGSLHGIALAGSATLLGLLLAPAARAQSTTAMAADSLTVASSVRPDSATPAAAAPAAEVPPFFREVQANAYVSLGYSYNANRPGTRRNGLRVFDQYDNTLGVDVAEVVLQRPVTKAGDAGFRVDLTAGSGSPESGQALGLSLGRNADLQQAFASYVVPVGSGLRLDAGKFTTHVGYEVYDGFDGYNSQYSRSLLFNYAGPFTHTGAKASYSFNSRVSAMVAVLNGWDNAEDNNRGKSVGAQLALVPVAPVAVYLNYVGGPEKTDTSGYMRNVFDVAATWKVVPRLSLGVNGIYGQENDASLAAPGDDAVWSGVAGYATVDATSRFALGLRGETMRDEGGTRFGLGEAVTVRELTLTPTYRVTDRIVIRADARFDSANQSLFIKDDGLLRKRQTTVAGNVMLLY